MGRRGYLTMPMFGYALAKFALARGEEQPPWERHLRPDVQSAYRMTRRFLAEGVEANPAPVPAAPPMVNRKSPVLDEFPTDDDGEDPVSLSEVEVLQRYGRGDRDFRNLCLRELHLCGADLRGSDLGGADLCGADL